MEALTEASAGRPLPGRRMLAESVYDAVKERIMDLTIPPDCRINIDHLARELDVSNTPVREALTRLETEGLVTRKSLYGFRTTGLLDTRGIRELYALRLLLEPEAARNAASRSAAARGAVPQPAGTTLADELDSTLGRMARSVNNPVIDREYNRYRGIAEADAEFHAAIASASGNALLASTLAGLNSHVHSYRLSFRSEIFDLTLDEHAAVRDALAEGDSAKAASAMRRHLQRSRHRLLRHRSKRQLTPRRAATGWRFDRTGR